MRRTSAAGEDEEKRSGRAAKKKQRGRTPVKDSAKKEETSAWG